jgi:O-antigen/teichoic acid export membrane protein
MIKGSAWMVAMRWAVQGIGLVSTMILARVLVPSDFGIVAMGMLVVGLLEVFSSLGVDIALIRNQNATRAHYDTAWTFRLLQGALIAVIIAASAPFAADYFGDERVIPVIQILSLGVFLDGLENIGVVAFRKDLDFGKEFRFGVFKKLLVFAVTVPFALALRNYWALVIGIVSGRALGVALSYLMHAYRPRPSLEAARELWSFSQWMLALNVATYAQNKIDEFVVGGMKDTSQMGTYNVASELALLPNSVLISPLSRALIPGYAKLLGEQERLTAAFLNVLAMIAFLAIPVCLGLVAIAGDFVAVVLGEKWLDAVPVLRWLALFCVIVAVASTTGNLLVALGKVRTVAVIQWANVLLLAPALLIVSKTGGITDIAQTRTLLGFVMCATYLYYLARLIPVSGRDYLRIFWRPTIAGVVMLLVVQSLHGTMFTNTLFSFIADVAIGVIVFASSIMFLWHLAGKPSGAENSILAYVTSIRR